MLGRCNNPNHHAYPSYGGRGIKICKTWRHFSNFAKFIMTLPGWNLVRELGLQMDRIDNDGDYEPGNIRLTSSKENAGNRRPKGKIKRSFFDLIDYPELEKSMEI